MPRTIRSGCARRRFLQSSTNEETGAIAPLLKDLRDLTPARVALGRAGASLPTKALLEFMLDHARARDAVHATFDVPAMMRGLGELGLRVLSVSSRARSRKDYLKRPDLGRMLDPDSQGLLASRAGGSCHLAIVVGDGLSPAAVNAHAVGLLRSLMPRLAAEKIEIGHAVIASQARVALGDEIGAILGARMVVVLIGERPGLSAADSPRDLSDLRPQAWPYRRKAQLRFQRPWRGARLR